jgi:chloride channel 7
MLYIWQAITGTPYPTEAWKWMDPGVMAAISAAGLLGGVNRLAVASTVIVVSV